MKKIGLLDFAFEVFMTNNNKAIIVNNRVDKTFKNLFRFKKLKNKKSKNSTYIKSVEEPIFLITDVKKTFNYLKKMFIKTLIL